MTSPDITPTPAMPKLRAKDRTKNAASAGNAQPHAVTIRHGGMSALRAARLDKRTSEWRFEQALIEQRVAHLGGRDAISEPEFSLVRYSARLELMTTLAYGELCRSGILGKDGALSGAMQAYLSVGKELRATLETIGLRPREKPVQSIEAYIAEQAAARKGDEA